MAPKCNSRARQAEGHANVAMRGTLASADMGQPEELPRHGPVEPSDVDVGKELHPAVAAIALQNHCLMDLLDRLANELLNTWRLMPCAFSWQTCTEACLHMVPERLPRDSI